MAREPAEDRWAAELVAWAIPVEIMAQAPEPPWAFPPALFTSGDGSLGELHRSALSALPEGGAVLDVGCGPGAASIPLAPPAGLLIGVDSSADMLDAFGRAATEKAGVAHQEVLGEWPAIAGRTPVADVVVCRNVVYNVANIVPFLSALVDHATARVVVELTERHPSVALRALWRRFWDLDRPDGPDAALFAEVVTNLDYEPTVTTEERPAAKADADPAGNIAFVRRRLCLDESHDPEIAAVLSDGAPTQAAVTTAVILSWDPGPRPGRHINSKG